MGKTDAVEGTPLAIAHLDTGLPVRGGQEVLLRLASGLAARGHRQLLISPGEGDLVRHAVRLGLAWAALPRTPLGLRGLLRRGRFQLVHAHSGHAQTLAYLATVGTGLRRIATRHVAFVPRHPTMHRLNYTWTCHGVIAVSGAVRDVLLDAGVPASLIEVIHTGIDWPGSPPTPQERLAARSSFGLTGEDFVAGHLGAFTAEKGQDVALEAAALLAESHPRLRLVLAGDGPLLASIRLRAASSVLLPGPIADRRALFAALDLFLMPSRSEGWGLAALEAMAHGVPVIASDTGGLREIVAHGVSGWLIPPGDPRVLADAMAAVAAADPVLRAAAGLAARERARSFTLERTVERTEAFYRRVLGGAA
jgi:glycosyltransferase involved in cell wall biosynthesis